MWTLRDKATGQVTTLAGVERLAFADQAVALDLGEQGSLQPAMQLLAASFGAKQLTSALSSGLFGEFVAELDAHGLPAAAQLMVQIGLLQKLAGGNDMADVLTLLHRNVEGRAPDAAELQALLAWQQANDLSMSDLLLIAATHADLGAQLSAQLNPQELLQSGLAFVRFAGAVIGTPGDDHMNAVTGVAQMIDAQGGVDTLRVHGDAADYLLHHQSNGSWQLAPLAQQMAGHAVGASAESAGPVSTLYHVERLAFDDHNVALDLQGNAGMAARLLASLMGPQSVHHQALMGEVIAYVDDVGGAQLARIAQGNGLLNKLAGGSSMQALIELLYQNIAGQPPSAADTRWVEQLAQQQGWDRAELLMYAAQLPETAARIELSGLAQNGLAYASWNG